MPKKKIFTEELFKNLKPGWSNSAKIGRFRAARDSIGLFVSFGIKATTIYDIRTGYNKQGIPTFKMNDYEYHHVGRNLILQIGPISSNASHHTSRIPNEIYDDASLTIKKKIHDFEILISA